MKCPLKFNKEHDVVDGHILIQESCEEVQCAWWVIPYIGDGEWGDGRCAVYEMALKSLTEKILDSKLKGI